MRSAASRSPLPTGPAAAEPNLGHVELVAFAPLYQQIKARITAALRAGEWKPGALIPSESELAARYGASQGTVRKAIEELATENLLIRRQGKGTYVASHQEPRAQFRFLRLRPDHGDPTPLSSRILDCKRLRAPPEVGRALGLRPAESTVCVTRLLSNDAGPVVLDEIWLPAAPFKRLTIERLRAYRGPLYALFEAEYGTRMIRCDENLRAVAADATLAENFGVELGTPLLLVERLSYSYDDRPVEVRRGWYLTRDHHYQNHLS